MWNEAADRLINLTPHAAAILQSACDQDGLGEPLCEMDLAVSDGVVGADGAGSSVDRRRAASAPRAGSRGKKALAKAAAGCHDLRSVFARLSGPASTQLEIDSSEEGHEEPPKSKKSKRGKDDLRK